MIDVKDIPFTPTQVDSTRVGGTSTTTHMSNPHTCTYIVEVCSVLYRFKVRRYETTTTSGAS